MRIHYQALISIAATLVAAIAFTLSPMDAQALAGRRVVIEIRSFAFAPTIPVVRSGDTVVWINRDIVPHTATARDGSWDSGTIKAGGRWKMVVTAGLSEAYFCRFHPAMTARFRIARTGRASERQILPPGVDDRELAAFETV